MNKPDFDAVLRVASDSSEWWRTPNGTIYVTSHEPYEDIPVVSSRFRNWVRYRCTKAGISPVGRGLINQVADHISAVVAFEGVVHERAVRVGHAGGVTYVDLGSPGVVEIEAGSWRVISRSDTPIRFVRGTTFEDMTTPSRSGDVGLLRPLVNVADDDDFKLLVGFIVGCFSAGPYPLLCLEAPRGHGKSALTDTVRSLIDPDRTRRLARPKNKEDVIIAASTRYALSYDNLSGMPSWFSDTICLLSTGSSYLTRLFGTNTEAVVFEQCAPVILNGIDRITEREDLASRTIALELPRLILHKTEREMQRLRDQVLPRILGGIFDAVAHALDVLGRGPESRESASRMADHIEFVEAASGALGWDSGSYEMAVRRMQRRLGMDAIGNDPFASAVMQLTEAKGTIVGTASALLKALDDDRWAPSSVRRSRQWPKTPEAVGQRLRRLAGSLSELGVLAEQGEGRARRTWTLQHIVAPSTP